MAPLCTRCKSAESVYHRPYSGERLCGECFSATLVERVKRTINRFNMLEHNSRVAVGVSGGKDSLTLLRVLHGIEAEWPNSELVAVCVDEGIRGYRDEALGIAERSCRELGVEMKVIGFRELFGETMDEIASRDRELGACSYCGVLRRRALNEAARAVGADRLATGHNLDDMAQTVMLNILRGDTTRAEGFEPGGRGLGSYIQRIKPLCEVPERETAFYAYLKGFELQSVRCPYAEEAMRGDARRFLNQMEHRRPGTKFIVYQTGLKLASRGPGEVARLCPICGAPTSGGVCRVCELTGRAKI